MNKYYILIILIIVLAYYYHDYRNIKYSEINGVWIMDQDFADNAGLESMLLYIGDTEGKIYRKNICYIIANDQEGETIINQDFTIEYFPPLLSTYNMTISNISDEIFPSKLQFICDISNGTLVLKSKDKLYGVFIKNNEYSNLRIVEA